MKRHDAFTLTELLALAPITAMLGGLVLATLSGAQQTFQGAACLSNLRQWGLAFAMYANDYNNYVVNEGGETVPLDQDYNINAWFNVLPSYIGNPPLTNLYNAGKIPLPGTKSVFMCPALVSSNLTYSPNMTNAFFAYAMNRVMNGVTDLCPNALYKRSVAVFPSRTVLMCDAESGASHVDPYTDGGFLATYTPIHNGGDNFLFVDGHADWVSYSVYNDGFPPGTHSAYTEWLKPKQIYWFPCSTCDVDCEPKE
jgi:prepilin-type processing-associated H-X9-DG protein